jgi:hypothetical protein
MFDKYLELESTNLINDRKLNELALMYRTKYGNGVNTETVKYSMLAFWTLTQNGHIRDTAGFVEHYQNLIRLNKSLLNSCVVYMNPTVGNLRLVGLDCNEIVEFRTQHLSTHMVCDRVVAKLQAYAGLDVGIRSGLIRLRVLNTERLAWGETLDFSLWKGRA